VDDASDRDYCFMTGGPTPQLVSQCSIASGGLTTSARISTARYSTAGISTASISTAGKRNFVNKRRLFA
jgi:hypothetical protein